MKYLLFNIIAIILSLNLSAKENCLTRVDMIKYAIISFRDSLKKKDEDKFAVFVVHFYKDSKTQDDAVIISTIYNSIDFTNLKAHYYFWVGNIPVLIKDADSVYADTYKELEILNSANTYFDYNLIKIVQILLPVSTGYSINSEGRGFKLVFGDCIPKKVEFIRFLGILPKEETPFFDSEPYRGYPRVIKE